MGYDCLVIPGAAKMASPYTLLPYNAFCGQGGLITAAAAANVEATGGKTVCCKFLSTHKLFVKGYKSSIHWAIFLLL